MDIDDVQVGDKVVYKAPQLTVGELGEVTSFNPNYIFVRFGTERYSKAVRASDLTPLQDWKGMLYHA